MQEESTLKRLWRRYRVIVMYALVGCGTVPINWGVYSLCVLLFKNTVVPSTAAIIIANVLSWLFSSLFAYFGNKKFVFLSRDWSARAVFTEMALFMGIRVVSTAVELVFQPILAHTKALGYPLFGVDGLPAKIIVTGAAIAINYFFSKLFVFGKWVKKEPPDGGSQ